MPRIVQLSPSVINKIAAGEVIERPASVVKELVENSLDAGATRVDVSIEQGGIELIRIVDNGCGIEADQLPLAVASHATSKLSTADDLFRVHTMGFRGEALASISEVSRFTLRSRTAEHDAGAEFEMVAGSMGPVMPCSGPVGTTIEVRNLFFNTPVRRKFLKATQTEMGHISEAFTRLALAYPHVHFTLRHNERSVYELPPNNSSLERIGLFFGQDLLDDLIEVESRDDQVRLYGYVARPNQSRSHPRMQYLFLNGRFIRDRSLQHALQEAYRGLLLTGRYPIGFLHFEMPADMVDVNVHPTKLEVRFQDGSRLYSQLLGTLRTKFLSTDLTHRLEPVAPRGEAAPTVDPQLAQQRRQELVQWAQSQMATWSQPGEVSARENVTVEASAARPAPLSFAPPVTTRAPLTVNRIEPPARPMSPTEALSSASTPARALQFHQRYLIAESAEGLVVIDQHALHERVLYEQIREKVLAGALESQALLVPEPVDLAAAEVALVVEQREVLERLGLKVEPFGGDTVLIRGYPAMLHKQRPGDILRALVDQMSAGGKQPDRRDLLDELLHMISCKAAIKAGDPLTSDEIDALLEQRHLAQDTHHCPHGRPTALVFTREELDRQFKRI